MFFKATSTMKLVFDTNIIHEDFHLHGPRIAKLCSATEKLGYELMVPEVVVDEMANQYRKKILQNLAGYTSVLKMTARTQGNEDKFDKDAFLSEKVKQYELFLRQRLDELGIKVIAYPQVDAKALVAKELCVRKPFREIKDGIIGVRDSLIWESVKSLCKPSQDLIEDPQIMFLTANTKDFAGFDGTLHPDLVQELKNAGYAENCVSLVSNIDEFFKNSIDTSLEELEQIRSALIKTGKFNRFDVMEESERLLDKDFLTDILNVVDFDSGQPCYIPGGIEEPTVKYVDEPIIEDVTVRRLSDHAVLVEVQASVEVDWDFFVEKANYCLFEDGKMPSIIDGDLNDYYMLCEGSAKLSVNLTFTTTPRLGKIISEDVQVTDVEI